MNSNDWFDCKHMSDLHDLSILWIILMREIYIDEKPLEAYA